MDTLKTGRLISSLRRERGLTQTELGDILGVTNKTVSRWETGTYMPPIEVLELMSREFSVTINELVAGERVTDEDFKRTAEENLASAWHDSVFSLRERQEYFRKRWLKNHIITRLLPVIIGIALAVIGLRLGSAIVECAAFMIGVIGHIINYNLMMSYVEQKAFEKPSARKDNEPPHE